MLSEAKQKIFQARWRDKICRKFVESERERRCNMLSAAKKKAFLARWRDENTQKLVQFFTWKHFGAVKKKMTKPKKLTIFSPETAQFSTDFRLETCFCLVLKRFEAMFWSCSKRGKELSISKIYVSILDSTFSSRTTSKILEESESKKFDPKPAIKILNENVRSNRDRNRRRHQKKNLNDSKTIFTFGTKSWTKTQ